MEQQEIKAKDVKKALKGVANPAKAKLLSGFFKTGRGEYGAGDKFLGVVVPKQRKIAGEYMDISLSETELLLHGKFHEERFTALVILVNKFKNGTEKERKDVFDIYRRNTEYINNWDLVDTSAPNIIGEYLKKRDKLLLYKYAKSPNLCERRIAIISTLSFIVAGDYEDALKISEKLLHDKHDLIHKAVGWMLREVGKRCGEEIEEKFLNKYHNVMPRTMLRYAIERFPKPARLQYLKKF